MGTLEASYGLFMGLMGALQAVYDPYGQFTGILCAVYGPYGNLPYGTLLMAPNWYLTGIFKAVMALQAPYSQVMGTSLWTVCRPYRQFMGLTGSLYVL